LKEKVKSDIRLLNMMIDLTPITKGKKIRSTLFYLLNGLRNPTPNETESLELVEIASALEMFHLSSLIHDDIMDNSEQRRGEKTLNTNIGNFRSVLWGDYLFISAFTTIHNLGKPLLLDTVLRTAKIMVEGQIIEVENAYNFDIDLETYYDIINRKTSSLFAAVALMVPLLHAESQLHKDSFYQFGLNFGTIFQVSDDMLDIFSTHSGKDRFRDMEEGKLTLPFILLMKETGKDAREAFSRGNRDKILSLFEKYNIKELCMEKIADYHRRCLDFLNIYPDSVFKKSLLGLLDFVKYRDY
jgi:octaprenyl-diphosphate synthase